MCFGSSGHPKVDEMGRKHGPSRGITPHPSRNSGRLRVKTGKNGIADPAAGPAESCLLAAGHVFRSGHRLSCTGTWRGGCRAAASFSFPSAPAPVAGPRVPGPLSSSLAVRAFHYPEAWCRAAVPEQARRQ